jgi:DNA-binding CsgD family transcriptional regulator
MLLVFFISIILFPGIIALPVMNEGQDLKKELSHISKNVSRQFGDASVQAVSLSSALSRNIAASLDRAGLGFSDLPGRPELIETIIDDELNSLLAGLDKTSCTGVFMVLDTTVNPALPNARYSRAGLYIRNTEPLIPGISTARLCLRGMPGIVYKNGMSLQARWDMEFKTGGRLFYNKPIEQYLARPDLPLSRLYFWTMESAIPDLDEPVILCSVPIIGADGEAMGVCGFEISAINFRYTHAPDLNMYPHIVSLFASLDSGGFHFENCFSAGNYTPHLFPAQITEYRPGLAIYQSEGTSLVGAHEELRLYPLGSPFADQNFALALAVPRLELERIKRGRNIRTMLIFSLLLFAGITLAFVLSRHYVKPITESIKAFESGKVLEKTNITEIDELIDRINALRKQKEPLKAEFFSDFLERCKTLTPAERELFDFYAKGFSRKEILEKRGMSDGTFNSHSAHIFSKLGIRSKEEIALYMELMRKSGIEL